MRSRTFIIALPLIACVVVAAFYLAPNRKEMALMQMKDSHYKEALTNYTSLQQQGDGSVNVVAPMIDIYVNNGELDKAIPLLEDFISHNPKSLEGRKRLAELYKSSQHLYDYCRVLEEIEALSPSSQNVRELADTYDFLGQYQKEEQALVRLEKSPNNRMSEDSYLKLASFLRIDQQPHAAQNILLAYIDRKKGRVSLDAARLAAQMLEEDGNDRKALALANDYLRKNANEPDAIAFSSFFQTQGKLDTAYAVLEPFLPNLNKSTALERQVVSIQLEQNKYDAVYTLLAKQFKDGQLSHAMEVPLLDLAVRYKDYELTQKILSSAVVEGIPQDSLVRYADFAIQSKRPDLAMLMHSRLPPDYLRDAPLLSAVLEIATRDTPGAMQALLALPRQAMVLSEQKIMVAGIYLEHGYVAQAYDLLNGIPINEILESLDAAQVAALYLDTGAGEKGLELLANAQSKASSERQDTIDKARFLICVGEGKADDVRKYVDSHSLNDVNLLEDAYYFAKRHHHDAFALDFAEKIYPLAPTPQNGVQLAEELLVSRRYAEALKYLQVPAAHDAVIRAVYLDGIAQWIRHAGLSEMPPADKEALLALITTDMRSMNLSLDEKRNLAYILDKTGLHDRAEGIFIDLAATEPFNGPDMQELLALWGEHPSPAALRWMQEHARTASGVDRLSWLKLFNDINHPEVVVAILNGREQMSQGETGLYIDALQIMHNTDELQSLLAQQIDATSDVKRLQYFAKVAEEESLQSTAERVWRKIYEIDPDNSDALMRVGMYAYQATHYKDAEVLLTRYLKDNNGDYHVNLAYGEILQHSNKKDEAQTYFSTALSQVSEIKEKTTEDLIEEAHLLYRNNELDKSTALFRSLLDKHPENKELRADFAQMLIESRQYKEASAILPP